MSGATKRPWKWEKQFLPEDLGKSNGVWILDENHEPIASVCEFGNEEANAELIVQAVNCHDELLDACKEFISECDKKASWDKVGGAYMKAKRAIAKAEGVKS